MKDAVLSIKHVPIRLTDERWVHITEEHCELAGLRLEVLETVANPEIVLTRGAGELLAVGKLNINYGLRICRTLFENYSGSAVGASEVFMVLL